MAESPNLIGEIATRLEAQDNRPIWLMTDIAARDALTPFEGQRTWLIDDTKYIYTAGSWVLTNDDYTRPYPDFYVGNVSREQFKTSFENVRGIFGVDFVQTVFPA